ncbi:MAG: hypothetical protein ACRD4P_16035, partial [Bryobacteraceae bacterium]
MRSAFLFFLITAEVAAESPSEPAALLEQYVHLHKDDIGRINAGRVVVKRLETHGNSELGLFGVARVGVPIDFFLEQYRNIETFKKDPAVLQIGKFSDPPRVADLDKLNLGPEEIELLKSCVAGGCKVKLSEQMIARLRTGVDWTSPNAGQQATSLMHDVLVEYVKAYLAGGNAAMITYDDKKPPVPLDGEFLGLLKASPYIREYAPAFYDYLAQVPGDKAPDIQTFIYWSEEKFGPLKPVLALTQVTIYRRSSRGLNWCFIASKQIYASHYFDGSLGLTILLDAPGDSPGPRIWIMYLNRSRADGLGGFFGSIKRALI